MSEWIFPDHDPCFDEPVSTEVLEEYTTLARARKEDELSTHDYRVRKRRMCQALGLRADKTTMAQLREAWAAAGLRWPDDNDLIDNDHAINLEDYKENTMTTKKNAATTNAQPTLIDIAPVPAPKTKKATTKKENAMEKTAKPKQTVADVKASYDRAVAAVRVAYDDAMPIDEPVNPITGRPVNKDAVQRDNLRYLAADLGWTSNEFATVAQVKSYGGEVREGAYRALQFMPGRFYYVVNLDDVTWPNGRPEFTPENKVEKPKKEPKKTTKATPKDDAKVKALEGEVSDLKEMMAQMMAQNAALIAALTKSA